MTERDLPSSNVETQPDDERLTPELSALEARLSTLTPRVFSDADAADETKRRAFLFLRRRDWKNRREFDVELAETIVRTGEQRIVVSLRRYLRTAQISSFLGGLICGVLLGAIASFFAFRNCAAIPEPNPRTATVSNVEFVRSRPFDAVSPDNFQHSLLTFPSNAPFDSSSGAREFDK